jgi:hypothetical protein
MSDIIDPRVIRFCNESLRPIAEKMRELDVLTDNMDRKWFNEISDIISANVDADPILDGRTPEGVSVLTKNDLVLFITQAIAYNTQMSGAGVREVINKPCVRTVIV